MRFTLLLIACVALFANANPEQNKLEALETKVADMAESKKDTIDRQFFHRRRMQIDNGKTAKVHRRVQGPNASNQDGVQEGTPEEGAPQRRRKEIPFGEGPRMKGKARQPLGPENERPRGGFRKRQAAQDTTETAQTETQQPEVAEP